MQKVITAKGYEADVRWAAPSHIDGSFRFQVVGDTVDFAALYSVFSNPEHTQNLTVIFDENQAEVTGYTELFRMEKMPSGDIVVGLKPAD